MEALYSKLYDKYSDLKAKKKTEMDRANEEQEMKFMKYVSAAEELIQYLRNENNDLRNQVASARASNEGSEYQKLWIEECQKNKVLSEENETLHKLHKESSSSKRKRNEKTQENTPQMVSTVLFDSSSGRMTRSKRQKLSATKEAGKATHQDTPQVDTVQEESTKELHNQTLSTETITIVQRSDCCRRTIGRSGDDDSANCIFQALVEYLVGMKFSVMTQNQGTCLSAEHPSSGYSFSLTWLEKSNGKEVELQYHVLSLGTFERVAPEWMKEAIMFSVTMCPIFFERVSRVVKHLS